MQLQKQVPEKVLEKVAEVPVDSGVPVQMADESDEVPEGSGADRRQGSGGFRGRWLMRLWRVAVRIADKVPEGSGADG